MIRELGSGELELAIEGGKEFFAEGKMPGGFRPEAFVAAWKGLIDSGRGAILGMFEPVLDGLPNGNGEKLTGGIAAVLAPDLWNGDLTAVECLWFVRQEHRGNGLRLLRAFEDWARERGAKRVAMVHLMTLQPEALGQLYERMEYRLVEKHYVKELVNKKESKLFQ